MEIAIRKSTLADISDLSALFDEARGTIKLLGIDQWQNGYPSREVIANDIEKGVSYTVLYDGEMRGTFALIENGEPTYDKIFDGEWQTGYSNSQFPDYFALHRVAISVSARGTGLSTEIIGYAKEKATAKGKRSLRIDTHRGNVVMRRMLEKHGFVHCGTIFLESGDERVAYELII
ncbi:MAG: N-acetyltransferase [Clostridia bacterium]|nr:N-acetyltransferase [Clostridia bacterium]